ncbi:MAG: hypothetical protein C4557_08880 [Anaerolineaceae bacterium]|jgi:hypothetical protein|nr:MAG: hypothetical protein C4557_08880 [Anaerolineaceae bacterium]
MILRILRGLEITVILLILAAVTGYSNPSLSNPIEKVRAYTRTIEFNYIAWMFDAARLKVQASSVNLPHTLGREGQKQIVQEYLRITQFILEKEYALSRIYADAAIADKEAASETLRGELAELYQRQSQLAPLAEAILQEQVGVILAEIGLTAAGQPIPNVWYHSTPLPMALIVSPRERIEQTANISVETGITVDEQATLESRVDAGLNVSSLVVPVGGVGVYPSMVMRSTDLPWILSTIAHEWIHNYLTFRPLGILYNHTPELRTMNETTASIAGDEIGALALEKFYPELTASASPPTLSLVSAPFDRPDPGDLPRPPFDFRAQMHETRVNADALLAEGRIEEAEAYMEARRQIFLKNGYLLRKINQAYFAFYGAYADAPGGAAGEDPVGPAVRALRKQSGSLADFVNTISWMWSFEQLQEEVDPK